MFGTFHRSIIRGVGCPVNDLALVLHLDQCFSMEPTALLLNIQTNEFQNVFYVKDCDLGIYIRSRALLINSTMQYRNL